MLTELKEHISQQGWAELNTSLSEDSLSSRMLEVAALLTKPIRGRSSPMLERLSPTRSDQANPNSLSGHYGLGSFPFHTDYAHWLVPPRLIIVGCSNPGSSPSPTVLVPFRNADLSNDDMEDCHTGAFVVRNGRRSFYSTVLDRSRPFLRFDQDCMKPVCPTARNVADRIAKQLNKVEPTTIHWEMGKVLIIDNWQVLHGRGASPAAVSPDRCLFRICVQ